MIKIKCESSNFLALNEITDFQGDLKERSAGDMEKIKKSIKKHGVAFPIFIWQTEENGETINYCLDGHCRTRALREMAAAGEQIPPLPVDYIHAETEAEAKELLLKLNSQYGHMTADSVAAFLGDIKIDFDELALPDGVLDLGKLEPEETKDDDEAPAVDEDGEPDSQRGQLYRLGRHFLYCGDSTSAEDMRALMGDVKADLIVTDPPYNVDYENKAELLNKYRDCSRVQKATNTKIDNDKMDDTQFTEFLQKAFSVMFERLKTGGVFYIWYAQLKSIQFETALKNAGGASPPIYYLGKKSFFFRNDRLSVETRALFIRLEKRRKSLLGRTARPYDRLRRKAELQENEQRGTAAGNYKAARGQSAEYDYLRGQTGTQRGTPDNEAGQTISTAY